MKFLPGSPKGAFFGCPTGTSQNNSKAHDKIAANANKTQLFFHAKTRPLKSGKDKGKLINENINVNGKKIARYFKRSSESSCWTESARLRLWAMFV